MKENGGWENEMGCWSPFVAECGNWGDGQRGSEK